MAEFQDERENDEDPDVIEENQCPDCKSELSSKSYIDSDTHQLYTEEWCDSCGYSASDR